MELMFQRSSGYVSPGFLLHAQFCLFRRVCICSELSEFLPLLWPWGYKCQDNDSNTFLVYYFLFS